MLSLLSLPSYQPQLFSLISRCWILLIVISCLPGCQGVTFYFGAEKTPLEQQNFATLAAKPNSLSNDELKSVYSFCNLLPLLQATGRMNMDKRSSETCTQLMKILKPIFDKRSTMKRSSNFEAEVPTHRIRTPGSRRISRPFFDLL
ncbi:unnamed protein product [Bursaphelenchus xylophilus]|uniref:(pine wood nematode) hypothetical protein n=1 Tax=Bursaphelenchus xylophilus TaxID=6326 RepID=A0A1I7S4S5_BURXY|nr:unnamed protein product [Bursaphelenchus xylophilus]CAG9117344.1 unnamed protein product [Bursaphelenchus xylophilus]